MFAADYFHPYWEVVIAGTPHVVFVILQEKRASLMFRTAGASRSISNATFTFPPVLSREESNIPSSSLT